MAPPMFLAMWVASATQLSWLLGCPMLGAGLAPPTAASRLSSAMGVMVRVVMSLLLSLHGAIAAILARAPTVPRHDSSTCDRRRCPRSAG
jgi:hypothetical protein